VLQVKLREAMEDYKRRTGERMTYNLLAERTGLSRATIESLASRQNYNARLSSIEKICQALGCAPGALLEVVPDE
jgi:DNA-binding Xre family transcriptional regulator